MEEIIKCPKCGIVLAKILKREIAFTEFEIKVPIIRLIGRHTPFGKYACLWLLCKCGCSVEIEKDMSPSLDFDELGKVLSK